MLRSRMELRQTRPTRPWNPDLAIRTRWEASNRLLDQGENIDFAFLIKSNKNVAADLLIKIQIVKVKIEEDDIFSHYGRDRWKLYWR